MEATQLQIVPLPLPPDMAIIPEAENEERPREDGPPPHVVEANRRAIRAIISFLPVVWAHQRKIGVDESFLRKQKRVWAEIKREYDET